VGSGWGNGKAYARMGQTEIIIDMIEGQLLPQKPASPLHRVVTRRPTAATMLTDGEVSRSTKAVLICQPQAGEHLVDRSSVPTPRGA